MTERLDRHLAFLVAADRLKTATGEAVLMDGSRRENLAERAWHRALWALLCAGPADGAPDRLIALCLVADLAVETIALLPPDQAATLESLRQEASAAATAEARALRRIALAQDLMQQIGAGPLARPELEALTTALDIGPAAALADDWPELHAHLAALLSGRGRPAPDPLGARLRFLAEADRLKSVLRGTTIFDGTRRETSAEHSWHLALFALTLGEHAVDPPDPARAVRMLLLHDLVEIDAGDAPIHGNHDPAAQEEAELRAAERLYGLLPSPQDAALRAIWDEFEAARSVDAVFARSIDRVQPVLANLATGGGTWTEYSVTRAQLETRVGDKVRRGAPILWDALVPRLDAWFGPA
ncbi:HD domain-containing protein [Histidinibacterium lentulum]|uniref:HD domain-containing protein n=1 Tax=Histidinibacterium lentulum TaxID=2480588 RepID=A0A3N2R9L4_9RHOB|nr:HD domain-containing protein [Histidinibacterium lentulum]ROU04118.1 HD domain-containing protein [Histidinibacterium lentulum]